MAKIIQSLTRASPEYEEATFQSLVRDLDGVITKLNTYIADKTLTSDYTKFAAIQKDAVVTKKETKKEEKKIKLTIKNQLIPSKIRRLGLL